MTNDVTKHDMPPLGQQQRGAVSPGTIPPTVTVPTPLPPIEPATPVSGFAGSKIESRPANQEGAPRGFTLPDGVPAAQIKADSFRYGNASTPSPGRRR
jgi:hypothetical protein